MKGPKTPIVSVVVDTYNYGHFIEEAVESVLAQDFPKDEFEVIVVDDGSTDDTRRRMKAFKNKVRYVYQENKGQASAFNTGVGLASGEFVMFLDGDDTYPPDRLDEVVAEFQKYPDVATVLNTKKIITADSSSIETSPVYHNLSVNSETASLFQRSSYGTGNFSFRRSVLRTILPIPEALRLCADVYLTSMIWRGAVSSLDKPLYHYRIHSQNLWFFWGARNLETKRSCLKEAMVAVKNVLTRSTDSNARLNYARDILFRYEVWLEELEVIDRFRQKRLRRRDMISYEYHRMKLLWWRWNWWYRFYKILRFPVFVLFPADWTWKITVWYWRRRICRYRKYLFPD